MRNRRGETLYSWRGVFLASAGVSALAVVALAAPSQRTQAPAGQAPAAQSLEVMEAAGMKMSFEVASVKINKTGGRINSNISLNPTAGYSDTGGLLSATNFRLQSYLAWAYGLPGYEALRLLDQYPPWALTDRFDIEARAQGNPTKPQMQLMMQSLLADRFKLKVHYEIKDGPIFALVLVKRGQTGPKLKLDDGSCLTPGAAPVAGLNDGTSAPCGAGVTNVLASNPGREALAGRSVTIRQIAEFFPAIGGSGIDRPVVDRTGLSGNYDFIIEFTPDLNGPPPPNFAPDTTGPAFLEALQSQLGLKLESTKGPVRKLVIDHVEEPSPN